LYLVELVALYGQQQWILEAEAVKVFIIRAIWIFMFDYLSEFWVKVDTLSKATYRDCILLGVV